MPNSRATSMHHGDGDEEAATRCPNDSRCLAAVNFSPDGRQAGRRRQQRLAVGAVRPVGLAASSGSSWRLLRLRSTAWALSFTSPPFVHLTSPLTAPVSLSYASVPRSCSPAFSVYDEPLPVSSNLPPKQVDRGDSL